MRKPRARKPWFTPEKWDVSPHNYNKNLIADLDFPRKIPIIDSTIRKMDNMPGTKIPYAVEDKIKIASLLDEIGVAEVGFNTMHFMGTPRHKDILEGCKAISKQGFSFKMSSIVNWEGGKEGIDMTIDDCGIETIYMEMVTSEQMRKTYLPEWTWEKCVETLLHYIKYGKERGIEVGACLPDSTRADYNNLIRMANSSIKAGASVLWVADSFGCLSPEGTRYLIRLIRRDLVKNTPIIYHVHNDFGMATSQAIAAASAGAWPEGSSNGIGERSFAILEEIVLALELLYGVSTGIKLDKLCELSKLVEKVVGIANQPHKPITGETAFTPLFSSEYVDLLQGKPYMSSSYDPIVVGRKPKLVWWEGMLTPMTVKAKLNQMGLKYLDKDIEEIIDSIRKELAKVEQFPFWLTDERVEEICRNAIQK